jgi:(E)-4-hydroxy-3-methylbut-2-enyl-diphosphate synthase
MGCVVNGPGEAKEADIGIAAGKQSGLIFRQGEVLGKFPEKELLDVLCREAEHLADTLQHT